MTSQLTLPVGLSDSASFDNFHAPDNAPAVAAVTALARSQENASVLLQGASGTGKTHLAWAACRLARKLGKPALYVPMRSPELALSLLQDLPMEALVCVDDLESLAGNRDLQGRLFSLAEHINHASALQILYTTATSVRFLDVSLADLVSRLGAVPGHELKPLEDSQKSEALKLRAAARGLTISDEAVEYMLRHTPRDTHALFALLDQLDRASLAAQRRVTLPLVRDVVKPTSS